MPAPIRHQELLQPRVSWVSASMRQLSLPGRILALIPPCQRNPNGEVGEGSGPGLCVSPREALGISMQVLT